MRTLTHLVIFLTLFWKFEIFTQHHEHAFHRKKNRTSRLLRFGDLGAENLGPTGYFSFVSWAADVVLHRLH